MPLAGVRRRVLLHQRQPAHGLHQALPRVDDDLARTQRLAGDVGRTGGGAAAALRTRIAVEEVLPGELLHVVGAELLDVGLEVHGAHDALLPRSAGVREEHVEQRRHHVQVLGVRQVVQEEEHEQDVCPPVDVGHRGRGARRDPGQHSGEGAGDELLGAQRRRIGHPGEGEHGEQRHHQRPDHPEDEIRIAVVRVIAVQPPGMQHQPAEEGERDGGEHERREHVLRRRIDHVQRTGQEPRVAEPGDDPLDDELHRAGGEHQKAPEDAGMHRPRHGIAENLLLGDGDAQHVPGPAPRVVQPAFPLADAQILDQPLDVEREESRRDQQHEDEDHAFRGHFRRSTRREQNESPRGS